MRFDPEDNWRPNRMIINSLPQIRESIPSTPRQCTEMTRKATLFPPDGPLLTELYQQDHFPKKAFLINFGSFHQCSTETLR